VSWSSFDHMEQNCSNKSMKYSWSLEPFWIIIYRERGCYTAAGRYEFENFKNFNIFDVKTYNLFEIHFRVIYHTFQPSFIFIQKICEADTFLAHNDLGYYLILISLVFGDSFCFVFFLLREGISNTWKHCFYVEYLAASQIPSKKLPLLLLDNLKKVSLM